MHVLAVAQAFKETLSASEVAAALSSGIRAGGGEPTILVGSDGGDGLREALTPRFIRQTRHNVSGPLSELIAVDVGWIDHKSAIVESRLVCGLSLVPQNRRNPLQTSTRGVGELVDQLLDQGASEIVVGLGGSATMDGGLGMARAWGWIPRDSEGQDLPDEGRSLASLASFEAGRRPAARITGLVDVLNPLAGARVYAPQKGASPEQTELLAGGLERLARLAEREGKGELALQPGAGAAGGLGFGLLFFAGGSLVPGSDWVLDRIGFADALRGADLVLVGEGAFDATSLNGKLTGAVLDRAGEAQIRAGLLAPKADGVPDGVMLETGGDRWTAGEIARRATLLVERALRT